MRRGTSLPEQEQGWGCLLRALVQRVARCDCAQVFNYTHTTSFVPARCRHNTARCQQRCLLKHSPFLPLNMSLLW